MRYHITLNGETAKCDASERECPRGEANHFEVPENASKEEFKKIAEEAIKKSVGGRTFANKRSELPVKFVYDERFLDKSKYKKKWLRNFRRTTMDDFNDVVKNGDTFMLNGELYQRASSHPIFDAIFKRTTVHAFNTSGAKVRLYVTEEDKKNGNIRLYKGKQSEHQAVQLAPMYRRGYVGAEVDRSAVCEFEEKLLKLDAEAQQWMQNRRTRDNTTHYHATLLTPQETRTLKKNGQLDNFLKDCSSVKNVLTPVGLGTVREEDNQAWFVVCDNPYVDSVREKYDLPHKDYHLTLGFKDKDIHSQSKDRSTLIEK